MGITSKIIDTEMTRLRQEIRGLIEACAHCRNKDPQTEEHTKQMLMDVRGVWFKHQGRCYTCRTRGESAMLDHNRVIMRLFVLLGAR